MASFSSRSLVSDRLKPRQAFLRSIRSRPIRQARGTIASEPKVGSPLAILVPGEGVVITSPIVRILGLAGSQERLFQTRRGNVYALWVETESQDSEPAAAAEKHH